ncbi:hypothetical protein [Heyndrickxia oleronia]|uniref:Guanylate cyclase domain-containing protein n=1 Tax=Heyndrickxia oleronia TaxID=38875 RepID=A0AAW6T534_9BACI|nr:hypothetical protein [Heyndrickxia oleronia]MDH5163401.1 hypothetical protein [Heyndrickxia oleronia]
MTLEYDSTNPTLINSVVCFIDILGFQSLGLEAIKKGKGNEFLRDLHVSLTEAKKSLTPYTHLSAKVKVFTDNVVIGWPIFQDGEGELGNTFFNLSEYQFSLALNGYFIRGGISVGEHFMDEETVFGPALFKSYELESKVAIYPRITLSAESKENVERYLSFYSNKKDSPFYTEVLEDMDGEWFLNYLHILIDRFEEEIDENDYTPLYPYLKEHKHKIEESLNKYAGNYKLLKKYAWIANYHNYFCDEFIPRSDNFKISSPIKMSYPRRIL